MGGIGLTGDKGWSEMAGFCFWDDDGWSGVISGGQI